MPFSPRASAYALLCWLAIGAAAAQVPSASWLTFDAPGAGTTPGEGTLPAGINQSGAIAGYFYYSSTVSAFIRNPDGTFVVFSIPGASSTFASAINRYGSVTGYSYGANAQGYVRAADGVITTFGVANLDTLPGAINEEGAIAGSYTDQRNHAHGFLRSPDGRITTFDAPGAGVDGGTKATGINDNGVITGTFIDAAFANHGFLRAADGTFSSFDVPGAGGIYGQGTYPIAITDAGMTAGFWLDAGSVEHGFRRTPAGSIASIDVSGAVSIGASAINNEGVVIGGYTSGSTSLGSPGFVRGVPQGEIVSFTVPGQYPEGGQTYPSGINQSGAIAGWYTDTNYVYRGFLLQ